MDLCHKYRPKKLSQVVGQENAVKSLEKWVKNDKVPHVMSFTGPAGCGKTSLCRVMARLLGCKGESNLKEINASISRGIDTVREIQNLVNAYPLGCKSRVWIIDEAHGLTKDAQNSFLKVLEDSYEGKPDHAYFMLCTTEPTKLLKTIMSRTNEIKVKPVSDKELCHFIGQVIEQEGKQDSIPDEVIERIVEVAEGSPRRCLKILQQIIDLDSVDEMLEGIQSSDFKSAAFDIVKALMPFKGRPNWNDVKRILTGLKDEDPEGLRRLILSVCRTHMLKGGPMSARAYQVYGHFQDNYFDTGMTGLVASCYGATFN